MALGLRGTYQNEEGGQGISAGQVPESGDDSHDGGEVRERHRDQAADGHSYHAHERPRTSAR